MFFALDDNGNRICIDDANKQNKYFCPCCNYSVIVKQGKVNAWHYAHKPGSECDAAYSEKTFWHRQWQDRFPKECQEIIVQDITGYKRIADVKIDGVTIEFQSNSIPKDIFDARNRHHIRASSKVIWIFNCQNKEICETSRVYETNGNYDGKYWYRWFHPNRMLAKYYFRTYWNPHAIQDKDSNEVFRRVSIYLHTGRDIVEILWVGKSMENMKYFIGKPMSVESFVDNLTEQYKQPVQLSMAL